MNCREVLDRLDEYLDDALSPAERRSVEDHLGRCPDCRNELASIGALLDAVQLLPRRRVEPGRDLWPEIRHRLKHPSAGEGRSWRTRLGLESPRLIWPFAAAAVILLITLGLGYSFLSRSPLLRHGPNRAGTTEEVVADTTAKGLPRQLASLDTEVSSAREEVHQVVAADTSGAGPWKVFDENLQLLDQAIRDSRAALAQDPENPLLQRSLLGAYQKQLELLRWASRLVHQG